MVKIKELEWVDVTDDYGGLETHKCYNTLGWFAVYLNVSDKYTSEYANDEERLFNVLGNVISETKTIETAKQAAQEYHNKLVLSLLED